MSLRFENHKAFDAYLEKIDAVMRRDNIPITARPLQALSRISRDHGDLEFNISNAMQLENGDIHSYEGDHLTRRIIDWFEDLYGDRLKLSFIKGKSATIIRGDPYLMHIPFCIGDVKFTYDVKTLGRSGDIDQDGQTVVNVFDCLPGITAATVERVSRSEGFRLANELKANTYRFQKATKIGDYENVFDVRVDLDSTAHHIVAGQNSFGISRWHSLQAAEKALKSVLSCQGRDFGKTHDLLQLIHEADMTGISPLALNAATCLPQVRYESSISTLDQAMSAHHASLDICLEAAMRIAEVGRLTTD